LDSRAVLLRHFARDLCTRTEGEIRSLWQGNQIKALEKIESGVFERYVTNHNPIYYLACQVWFDNEPGLLYAPLHRDRIAKALLDYYFYDPETSDNAKDRVSGLLLLAQRDSFKSTFNHGVFPQFLALRERHVNNRDIRILMLHHREEQASLNIQRLKSKHMQSHFLRQNFPEFCSMVEFGTKTKFDWPCKTEGVFSEPSVMAAGLGSRLTGLHFDWMLNDDLVTEEDRNSKLIRGDSFFKYSTSRFMLDTRGGKEVDTGTRYHINDLYGKLIGSTNSKTGTPMYRLLHIWAGGKGTEFPLSYPNRHSQDFLDQKREEEIARSGNDILWWLQYQNEARTDRLMATDRNWIKHVELNTLKPDISRVLLVDPAWKGTKNAGTGDDAALAVLGFERRGFLTLTYLLDLVVSDSMTSFDGINMIFELMKLWGVTDVGVEEYGGHTFRTDLQSQAMTRGSFINLVDLKSKQTNKQERIVTFLRRVQAGQFFITDTCRNKDVFLSQFEDFPQVEKDDALDVVSYSADGNIAELFTPRWNTEAEGEMWNFPEPMEQRTRHCAL